MSNKITAILFCLIFAACGGPSLKRVDFITRDNIEVQLSENTSDYKVQDFENWTYETATLWADFYDVDTEEILETIRATYAQILLIDAETTICAGGHAYGCANGPGPMYVKITAGIELRDKDTVRDIFIHELSHLIAWESGWGNGAHHPQFREIGIPFSG